MSADRSYSKRSRDVRLAARSHLVALRAARRNRVGTIAVAEPDIVLPESGPAARVDDFQPDAEMIAAAEAVSAFSGEFREQPSAARCAATAVEPEVEAQEFENAPGEEEAVPVESDAAGDSLEPCPLVDSAAAGPEPMEAEPAVTTATSAFRPEPAPESVQESVPESVPESERERPDDRPDDMPSDLFDLPGAGSGLVWMLRHCGIHALEDLAVADVAQLRQSLGLVGQLLDVAGWVAFARERTAEPTAATGPDGGSA